jgi:fatty acid desaturase
LSRQLRDYRVWWALFVFFAVLSVLVVQRRYRRWRQAGRMLAQMGRVRDEQRRRLRLEGWRLILMTVSLLAMTGLVFAVFLQLPAVLLLTLRIVALAAVGGVVLLSLRL